MHWLFYSTIVLALALTYLRSIYFDYFVCGIFNDLQKAFDTVNQVIILAKLDHYGIHGSANSWLNCFINNRTKYQWHIQRFSVEGLVGEGFAMLPYGSKEKPWCRPGSKAPRRSKSLELWDHLLKYTMIKIYPSQSVIKLILFFFFFQKSCLNSSLKEILVYNCMLVNPSRPCMFTNYLSLHIK